MQQPDLVDTSQGKDAWKGDALSQILGEEKPGHVHGLGLVPNPDQVFEPTTSRRLKNINLTSLDAKSSEDVISLRLQMEKFERRIQSQDATILELKQKTKTLEQRQTQQVYLKNFHIKHFLYYILTLVLQGCSDDLEDVPKDGFCMDMPNSKRKVRISTKYSQNIGFSVKQILNYIIKYNPLSFNSEYTVTLELNSLAGLSNRIIQW